MNTLIIVNPASCGGRVKKKWPKVEKRLLELGLEFDVAHTEAPRHAIDIARDAATSNYDLVVCGGGDGTSNEIINGIMTGNPQKTAFGALPLGTGNDIAAALYISEDNEEAYQTLLNGKKIKCDLGKATSEDGVQVRYFAGIASQGLDSEVSDRSNRGRKWMPGTANYISCLLKGLISFKTQEITLRLDNEEVTDELILAAVANGPRYGAGMHICPDADVQDDLFDICIVRKVSKWTILRLFPKLYSGTHKTHPRVSIFRSKKVEIEASDADNPYLYQLDGEVVGPLPVKYEVIPRGLTVLATPNLIIESESS